MQKSTLYCRLYKYRKLIQALIHFKYGTLVALLLLEFHKYIVCHTHPHLLALWATCLFSQ